VARRTATDYDKLEKMYVTEDRSDAELAKLAGVTPQSVSEYGKRNDWPGKRAAYKSALARRGYEQVAEAVAYKKTQIIEESITVARATLRAYANGILEGKIPVSAKDAAEMIRLLVKELAPDDSRDQRDAPVVINGTADADFYRRLVETAQERLARGGVAKTAQPGTPGPRPD
jgi:hypothetical protein